MDDFDTLEDGLQFFLKRATPAEISSYRVKEEELLEKLLEINDPYKLGAIYIWLTESDAGRNLKSLLAMAALGLLGQLNLPSDIKAILEFLLGEDKEEE